MRETHVPLESVWERLVRAVKEGSKQPSKSLKGSKLRHTSNLTFLKSGLNLHTRKHRTRDKYVQKILLHIQNKSSYIFPWWKEKGTALNLPNSAAFTAILKLKLPQCNAIGMSTPPGGKRHHTSICGSSREVKTEGVLTAHRSENKEVIYPIILVEIDGFVRLK